MLTPINKFKDIKDRWQKFRSNEENKRIRIRDAAYSLGCSEADLLSTDVGDDVSYIYIDDIDMLFNEILSTDKVMLLSRNDSVVHEKIVNTADIKLVNGCFVDIKNSSVVLEYSIDSFKYLFFQKKMHAKKYLSSFQFFDGAGNAVLKIYSKNKSEVAFDHIALKYKSDYKYEVQGREQKAHDEAFSCNAIPVNFHFTNTILDDSYTIKTINGSCLRKILNLLSEMNIPTQIHCLGNCVLQYHSDRINNIVDYGPWLNVIDKDFNLHVLESDITSGKLLRYRGKDKDFFSIEFFDKNESHSLGFTSFPGCENEFFDLVNKIEVSFE